MENERGIDKDTLLDPWELFRPPRILPVLFRRHHRSWETQLLKFLLFTLF